MGFHMIVYVLAIERDGAQGASLSSPESAIPYLATQKPWRNKSGLILEPDAGSFRFYLSEHLYVILSLTGAGRTLV